MTWSMFELLNVTMKDNQVFREKDYNSELLIKARKMTSIMYKYLSARDLGGCINMVNVFGGVLKEDATRTSDFDLLIVWNRCPEGLWQELCTVLAKDDIMPADGKRRAGRFNTQHIMFDELRDELEQNNGRGGWLQRAAESRLRLWDEVCASDQS